MRKLHVGFDEEEPVMPNSLPQEVVMVLPQPRQNAYSMEVYGTALEEGLKKYGVRVHFYRGKGGSNESARRLHKYIDYAMFALRTPFRLLHIIDHSYGFLCHVASVRELKTIVTVHDVIPVIHSDLYPPKLVHSFMYQLRALNRADRVICVSQATRNELQQISERLNLKLDDKLVVIHEGVRQLQPVSDETVRSFRVRMGLNDDVMIILHVGSNAPNKNVDAIISSFVSLAPSYPSLRLLKVGAELTSHQKRVLAERRLNHRVAVLPRATREEVEIAYQVADIFVFPSVGEGFGFPPLEAMSAGLPVVVSDVPVFHEVLGTSPIFVNLETREDLVEKMRTLIESPGLRRELGIQGQKHAALFSWDHCVQKTLSVYQELLR